MMMKDIFKKLEQVEKKVKVMVAMEEVMKEVEEVEKAFQKLLRKRIILMETFKKANQKVSKKAVEEVKGGF